MSEQHLHNKIGNAIGEARRRLLDRLKTGADLEDACALFIGETRLAFEAIVRSKTESPSAENVSSQSM